MEVMALQRQIAESQGRHHSQVAAQAENHARQVASMQEQLTLVMQQVRCNLSSTLVDSACPPGLLTSPVAQCRLLAPDITSGVLAVAFKVACPDVHIKLAFVQLSVHTSKREAHGDFSPSRSTMLINAQVREEQHLGAAEVQSVQQQQRARLEQLNAAHSQTLSFVQSLEQRLR